MPTISSMPKALQRLAEKLNHLPGIGKRTAERLSLALLEWPEEQLAALGDDLQKLRQQIKACSCCGNYSEQELCPFCLSPNRQQNLICVVENASQIAIIESSNAYRGLYHVLGGKISPLNGKGPADLRIQELRERMNSQTVSELIIATSPDLEGEATAHFLAEEFKDIPILISRIASGIPAGADLSYADAATLNLALNGRRKLN